MDINLKTSDMFKMLKIVKKTGLFDNIKNYFKNAKGKTEEEKIELEETVGRELVISIIANIDMAEKEIYDFLAGVQNKKSDEIAEQDPTVTMEVLQEIFKSPVFKSFLAFFSK
ncbi:MULTISPECIES: hypothetical protein [Clostridium]|uniref:hypothetical protein n=1 Tax=Clostridium TaxID=1485 RepID=UPI000DFEE8D5|nr:hypothetical protein [Clostridium sporogenes]MCW6085581.1 hypothetical protein [Clostridium sporogenes]STC76885.1 Uncharacterised protein [Clostridium botulinum]